MSKASRNWKQFKCPYAVECINKWQYFHIIGYFEDNDMAPIKVGGVYTGVCFILPWRNLSNSSVPAPDQTSGGETPRDLELNWLHKQGDKKRTRVRLSMGVFWDPHLGLPRMPSFPSQYPPVTTSFIFWGRPSKSFVHPPDEKTEVESSWSLCLGNTAIEKQPRLSGTHALFTGSVHAQSLQSCLTLCDSIDCNSPAPLSMEFSRQEYWSGLPCLPPEDLSDPWIELTFLHLLHCRQILYHWATREALTGNVQG